MNYKLYKILYKLGISQLFKIERVSMPKSELLKYMNKMYVFKEAKYRLDLATGEIKWANTKDKNKSVQRYG